MSSPPRLEIWSARGDSRRRAFQPESGQDVANADFSPDSKELVVVLKGSPSEVVLLRADDDSVTARLASSARRALFLTGSSVLLQHRDRLEVWNRKTTTTLLDTPQPVTAVALSPDRTWLALAGEREILVYRLSAGAPKHERSVAFSSASSLWISDQGEVVGSDRSKGLLSGKGEPRSFEQPVVSVGGQHVLLGSSDGRGGTLLDSRDPKVAKALPLAGTLSADGALLLTDNHSPSGLRFVPEEVKALLATEVFGPTMASLGVAFTHDGKELLALSDTRVLAYSVESGRITRTVALPPKAQANGLLRGPQDVYVWGDPIARLEGTCVEVVGAHHTSRPRAFRLPDAAVAACVTDASGVCQLGFMLAPKARTVDVAKQVWFPLGLGGGKRLCEQDEGQGSSFGPCTHAGRRLNASHKPSPAWLTGVRALYQQPTGPTGGILVTRSAKEHEVVVHRVTPKGAAALCSLGNVSAMSEAMTLHPDGKRLAVPVLNPRPEPPELLVVDAESCQGTRMRLPASAVAADFSPDGHRLAVALADQTILVISL